MVLPTIASRIPRTPKGPRTPKPRPIPIKVKRPGILAKLLKYLFGDRTT